MKPTSRDVKASEKMLPYAYRFYGAQLIANERARCARVCRKVSLASKTLGRSNGALDCADAIIASGGKP